tara:strand:+ start:16474 stop:17055 length:582 start_codon:yes stop_codon:yes gene_type:complete
MNIENTKIQSIVGIVATALIILLGLMVSSTGNAAPKHENERHASHNRGRVIHHGPERRENYRHVRHHRNVTVVRSYGHPYRGYGHYYNDDDAHAWLAFTAITLKILDNLNEQQQREHEAAQVKATNMKVGETIVWNEAGASGSVTVVRDGTSTSGRYCREYQQNVTIGGKTESAYGTACMQADGTWEVVSTGA